MRLAACRSAVLGTVMAASVVTLASAQAPTVTVGGVGYAQYLYQLHKDTVTNSNLNNFDVTRAYINIVGKFSSGVGARITPDIYRNTDGSLAFRLKYAFASWTPEGSPLTFKLGQIHTPWLDWEEALWDYRMQGTMALERFKNAQGSGYMSSSDFGAGIDGKFNLDMVNFQVGVYNGEFYSKGEGDQHKDIEGRLSVRVLESDDHSRVGGLRITGYGAIGQPTGGGRRNRFVGLLSYKSKLFTLGAEYARVSDSLANRPPASGAPTVLTDGNIYSAYGVLNIPNSKVGLIARFDLQDPSTNVTNDHQTRIIGGISYQVNQNLRVLADIDNLTLQSGVYSNAVQSTRTQGLFQMQVVF
jgi:phosphate-selective porin O/P